jgi:predicted AAA+ superfamily ATPase
MRRSLEETLRDDLERKIVLLSGPRQVGKTTLAKGLSRDLVYLNYDAAEDRIELGKKAWRRDAELLVLDELHKMRSWKRWLKGIYDTEGIRPRILVTGSARLELSRRAGESLAGRFLGHRLYPLDPKEVGGEVPSREALGRILRVGGFPEPFLDGTETFYRRWRRSHLDVILRQDLIDLESVRDIQGVETLIELLRHRVGSPVSYASLARDLERDPGTVKRWISLLEELYVVFRITPFHRNIARSLLKEPKVYFFDVGQVAGDDGQRLENLVALALLKELHSLEDAQGRRVALHYLRTKEGRELDFYAAVEARSPWLIEVKWSDSDPSPHFAHFARFFGARGERGKRPRVIQLVANLKREADFPGGPSVRDAAAWLGQLDLAGELGGGRAGGSLR